CPRGQSCGRAPPARARGPRASALRSPRRRVSPASFGAAPDVARRRLRRAAAEPRRAHCSDLIAVPEIAEPPQGVFGVLVVAQGEGIESHFTQVVELVVLDIADRA